MGVIFLLPVLSAKPLTLSLALTLHLYPTLHLKYILSPNLQYNLYYM